MGQEKIFLMSVCCHMRCVLGTGLLGWEDTILARQGPSSSREQGSEKGGKAEVQAAGLVKAGSEASDPLFLGKSG